MVRRRIPESWREIAPLGIGLDFSGDMATDCMSDARRDVKRTRRLETKSSPNRFPRVVIIESS